MFFKNKLQLIKAFLVLKSPEMVLLVHLSLFGSVFPLLKASPTPKVISSPRQALSQRPASSPLHHQVPPTPTPSHAALDLGTSLKDLVPVLTLRLRRKQSVAEVEEPWIALIVSKCSEPHLPVQPWLVRGWKWNTNSNHEVDNNTKYINDALSL